MFKKILMILSLSCFIKTYSMELETSFLIDLKNTTNTSISKNIDTFYYEALYELMIKKSYDPIFCTIMFNENGLIPENQRIQPLPHVVN